MRTRNTALVAAICGGLAAALTGCGGDSDPDAGTNGVGKLSAATIESRARQAAAAADAVRLSGRLVTRGRTYQLDMRLKADGGTGQVATEGGTFRLLRVGRDLYLKAGASFWARDSGGQGGPHASAAGKLDDKYVKVPAGDPAYQRLRGFTDKSVLLEGILGLHGEVTTGGRGKVDGVRTIRLRAGEDGAGGRLDVSLEGAPYPLRLQRAGGAGEVRLADWNVDFPLAAPGKDIVVDYGRKLPAGT
ncbi:hypothetical protein RKE29_06155 [Streptomyces sp. B1866]|uniref:hypothetical protein n=1 Tax=Streptomyces sp. B1866 TaxID=3075431 RepID=UPI0028928305|nr:hypothetical protein [Streptomyces sp. B1866]MDT3396223.1 hypothetical protein [Streptomyces sp. B1866]